MTRRMLRVMLCALALAPMQAFARSGPDVIVGLIEEIWVWQKREPLVGISLGMWSCNVGDEEVEWNGDTPAHPVIAQNMYRIEGGRIEQIGLSWLKHGFATVSWNLCFDDCQPTDDQHLGVHCSDPYDADINGLVKYLGPRSQVNPSTGDFPYPFTPPDGDHRVRRIMVEADDIDPDLHPDARYVLEGQYVTADDAAAGNGDNNASYVFAAVYRRGRGRLVVRFEPRNKDTRQTSPAILAWAESDSSVRVTVVDVPGDGRLFVGSRAAELGNGQWEYSYAVENLNSHRAVGALDIPLASGAALSETRFHDVEYRGGEGENGGVYSNEDWTWTRPGDTLRWSTKPYESNINNNAIRWGTMYTFTFQADRPPEIGDVSLGLFRPGTPGSVSASAMVPSRTR